MPQNVTDSNAFTDPIVEMADSDPKDATYIRTAIQGLANRTKYLREKLAPQSMVQIMPVDLANPRSDGTSFLPDWIRQITSTTWSAFVDAGILYIPIVGMQVGDTLTEVQLHVSPKAAHATGTDRMRARIYQVTHNFSGPSPASADAQDINSPDAGTTDRYDAGTSGTQLLTLVLATPIVVTNDKSFFVELKAVVDAATAGKHSEFNGCKVYWTTADRR